MRNIQKTIVKNVAMSYLGFIILVLLLSKVMAGQVRMINMKYHITNPTTGEIEEIETEVDIGLLEEYNAWVIDNKLNAPTYSPQEFAKYLETKKALLGLQRGLEYAQKYNSSAQLEPHMIETLVRILKNEE
jgi:hypothetical protein